MIIVYMILMTICNPANKIDCKSVIYGDSIYPNEETCKSAIDKALDAPGGSIMKDSQCIAIISER